MAAQFYQSPFGVEFQLTPSHTTSAQTITTTTSLTKISQILVTSTDTAAKDIQLLYTKSSIDYLLGTFSIPLRSGDINSAPTVQLLRSAQWGTELNSDIANNKVLEIPSGAVLKVKAGSTLTAGKVINLIFTGESFT